MVKIVKRKKAIAMIELIFALVIMGIVLMSAPMLIQQSVKSSNIALQQEAIVAAASQTSIILSMHWDEENTRINVGESPILNTPLLDIRPLFGILKNSGGGFHVPPIELFSPLI